MVLKTLSVIVPVLNESGNMKELIHRIGSSVPDAEIIFVDDGSDDGTKQMLKSAAEVVHNLTYVFNDSRLGHMGSYLKGIERATSDKIVIMDADLQHPPEALPDFVYAFQKGFDIVIGTRFVNGRFVGKRSLSRGAISRGADLILRIVVPQCRHVGDPVSGFVGFTKGIAVPVTPEMKGNKLLPFLLVANRDAKIGYVPYRFSERKSGKSKIVSSGTSYIRNFLREVMDIRRVSTQQMSVSSKFVKK